MAHRTANISLPIGSWFTLERWITDTPFRQAAHPAASDLDVAKGTKAKEILERHWDTWITQRDWDWMDSMGVNSVRIPVRIAFSLTIILKA
jgi:aryl-phospho-beta-D-glucosidase BglC (GH1 family)